VLTCTLRDHPGVFLRRSFCIVCGYVHGWPIRGLMLVLREIQHCGIF